MAAPNLISPATNPAAAPADEAGERTVTLPITGMSCAACQVHVERALLAVPGVEEAAVNLLSNSARVRLGPNGSTQALVEAVRESGYEAELPVEPAPAASRDSALPGEAVESVAADADRSVSSSETLRRREESGLRRRAIFALIGGALLMVCSLPFMSSEPPAAEQVQPRAPAPTGRTACFPGCFGSA